MNIYDEIKTYFHQKHRNVIFALTPPAQMFKILPNMFNIVQTLSDLLENNPNLIDTSQDVSILV